MIIIEFLLAVLVVIVFGFTVVSMVLITEVINRYLDKIFKEKDNK